MNKLQKQIIDKELIDLTNDLELVDEMLSVMDAKNPTAKALTKLRKIIEQTLRRIGTLA